MKKIVLLATALVALASCTSDSYTGDQDPSVVSGEKPISFAFDVPAATRAGGEAAATALGNQFIVYGEKSETSKAAPSAGNLVFPNYQVNYTANTAYTTTSNTQNWEYVGYAHSAASAANIKLAGTAVGTAAQTIKFWDYGASNYVFTAVSAKQTDISSGAVIINKIQAGTTDKYDKGYTITLTAAADATKLYFSDREEITASAGTDRTADNAYGGNVTLTFRNATSQIRAAMYETISGYSVKIDKFYYADNANPVFTGEGDAVMSTANASNFAANVPNLKTGSAATLTVTYYNSGTRLDQPKVSVSGSAANYLTLGTKINEATSLATTAATPTYDQTDGAYTTVFPQESNAKSLKLKVDYTLTAPVTGEVIKVTGATAEIPAEYLQWKGNFKYTYIFKISKNTNGTTGQGVVGLYPITFDAVEIVAEDGQAEYITTVSEPSITTFGVSGGKYVHDGSEYAAGSDIYATFLEGSTVKTPTVGESGAQHVNIFKVTTADAENFPITEASVAEAIANPGSYTMSVDVYTYSNSTYTKVTDATTLVNGTTYYKTDGSKAPGEEGYTQTAAVLGTDYIIPKVTPTNISTDASTNFTAVPAKVTEVPGEDGVNITINALKLTGVKAGTYAIEYEASAAWTGSYKKVYKVIVVQ